MDDDIMFRINIDQKHFLPINYMNLNQAIKYGYMGTKTYNSVYDSNILEFLKLNGYGDWHVIDINDTDVMTMLGVKYFIVYDDSEILNSKDYTFIRNIDHLKLYLNNNFRGFGYTAENIDHLSQLTDLKEYDHTIFIDDEDFDLSNIKGSYSEFIITEKGNNHIKGRIISETENILQLPIPKNKGWKILVNGVEQDAISVNGGFIGIPINPGDSFIELYFVSYGFKFGLILSCLSFFVILTIIFSRKFFTKNYQSVLLSSISSNS